MTALTVLGILVYAAIMRGKYIVMFEMDDKGVKHAQIPSQAKKAQKLSAATARAGASFGGLTAAGAGMMASRTSMYTAFSDVRKVKAYPRRNIIKLNERLEHNQVYASLEDFDFVYQYIYPTVPPQNTDNLPLITNSEKSVAFSIRMCYYLIYIG